MNFETYFPLAAKTCKVLDLPEHHLHMSIGVAGELGELLDAVKKHVIYEKPLDVVNVVEELGDVWWYVVNEGAKIGLAPHALTPMVLQAFEASRQAPQLQGFELVEGLLARCHSINSQFADADVAELPSMIWGTLYAVRNLCYIYQLLGLGLKDLLQSLELNIAKLRKRYPDDIFAAEQALNRDLGAERAVLEGRAV